MINKVTLVGRLGSDTEIKEAKNGKPFTKLNIATSSGYYDQNKKYVEKTDWHTIIAWWKIEATKGETVYIEGELNYSEDKKAIIKANIVKVISQAKQKNNLENYTEQINSLEEKLPF